MQIIRKYKKLSWFDFLDYMEAQFKNKPDKTLYFEFLDEIRLRLIEVVSEGAAYKFKMKAKDLNQKFIERKNEDETFANEDDIIELNQIIETIL